MFLATIQRFNSGNRLNDADVSKYEKYFQFRWEYDKNLAISSVQDQRIMTVLPDEIEKKIYKEFLFLNFIRRFYKYFDL